MLIDVFFVLIISFFFGNLFSFLKIHPLIFALPTLIFFLKCKNLKISLLLFLFFLLGFFYFLLREEVNFKIDYQIPFYRTFIEDKIKKWLPLKEANFLIGILFGTKFEDYEFKEKLNKSGLGHITAISGQNLTIMLSLAYETLTYLPFLNPSHIFLLVNFLIFSFIFIMGFEGSVLRSAIMAFFLILSKAKFGRIPLKRNILALTLLTFLILDPKLIFQDIGTQFSFLAIVGILYISPLIEKNFNFKNLLSKTVSEILGAQIMVLPLIFYYFGNYNLFSFLANILVSPTLPFLLSLGYLLLVFPIKFLSWLVLPLVQYIILIAEVFSQIGIIYFKAPIVLVIFLYSFIFYEIYLRWKNEIPDFHFNFK